MDFKKILLLVISFSIFGVFLVYHLVSNSQIFTLQRGFDNSNQFIYPPALQGKNYLKNKKQGEKKNNLKSEVTVKENIQLEKELLTTKSSLNIEEQNHKILNNVTYFSPKKKTDRYSYYYGIDYLESYGLAQKTVVFSKLKRSEKWRELFPDYFRGILASEKLNPKQNSSFFTSGKSEVLIPKTSFQVGDEFVATIQAKDRLGRNKIYGGDYFRARLIKGKATELYPADAINCLVTDNNDGTYSITTPILFAGTLTLDVTLISSVESLKYMLGEADQLKNKGFRYIASLTSNESVECNWYFSELSEEAKAMELCDYENPRNEEPWICTKPKSGICHKISYIKVDGRRFEQTTLRQNVIKKFPCHVRITGINSNAINFKPVKDYKPETPSNACSFKQLSNASNRPNGYFKNNNWESLLCKNKDDSQIDYRTLFQNKQLYLIGDSTTRQIYEFYRNKLALSQTCANLGSEVWQKPCVAFDNTDNITIYYRAHGPPLRNPGPPLSRPYISDLLDGIDSGGKNVAIVFNIGLHIFTCHASMYIHRVQGIKEAAQRLIKRHPKTKVIFRLPNAIDNLIDWFLFRQIEIAKHIFKDVEGVLLLDFWDLTNLWLLNDAIHPGGKILTQEINFLTQIVGLD